MTNDEPTMTRDELAAAFGQLTDPAWVATIPTYREKQRKRYTLAMAQGNRESAQDAVWRAASDANLLTQNEFWDNDLSPSRVAELISLLGW